MLKHVLVPLDGSRLPEEALSTACELLGPQGILTLLTVIDMPDINLVMLYGIPSIPPYENNRRLLATAQTNAHDYLQHVAERLQLPQTLTFLIEVHEGDPSAVIVERAKALHVDAIVMSTHGRSGISRWMYGSVTHQVLALMPCPVLMVPHQSFSPIQQDSSDAVTESCY